MNVYESVGLRVLIVRPGATELDEQGRIAGSLDVPLSETGEQQVAVVAGELEQIDIARRMIALYPDDLAWATSVDEVEAALEERLVDLAVANSTIVGAMYADARIGRESVRRLEKTVPSTTTRGRFNQGCRRRSC